MLIIFDFPVIFNPLKYKRSANRLYSFFSFFFFFQVDSQVHNGLMCRVITGGLYMQWQKYHNRDEMRRGHLWKLQLYRENLQCRRITSTAIRIALLVPLLLSSCRTFKSNYNALENGDDGDLTSTKCNNRCELSRLARCPWRSTASIRWLEVAFLRPVTKFALLKFASSSAIQRFETKG